MKTTGKLRRIRVRRGRDQVLIFLQLNLQMDSRPPPAPGPAMPPTAENSNPCTRMDRLHCHRCAIPTISTVQKLEDAVHDAQMVLGKAATSLTIHSILPASTVENYFFGVICHNHDFASKSLLGGYVIPSTFLKPPPFYGCGYRSGDRCLLMYIIMPTTPRTYT